MVQNEKDQELATAIDSSIQNSSIKKILGLLQKDKEESSTSDYYSSGHVIDNGEPPQHRYYCSYCPGPVQIGFCKCEKGKKYAYR